MQIQKLQEKDLTLFYSHAKEEQWDIEDIHIPTLLKTNPKDFFIFYENKKLLGYVVALKESEQFGFISSLLVLKEFRSLGYGKKILTVALKHLQNRQIALDSVLGQETFYEKFSFKRYFDVSYFKFIVGSVALSQPKYDTIDFDAKLSLDGQSEYTKLLLQNKNIHYKAIKSNNTISAFAFSFTYKDGYKITLNAEDINEAISLFFALTNNYKKNTNIYIQVTRLSPILEAITEALQMSEVSKMTRMYNKVL
ncbi:GCN5-related N-acetyltransferase [hydrothermal vent metagenome]|uniref:GCN5-related N-acetyltransferase n=1 Tax=hydrothermal vent metagenome TaxID=652676 RepID=A0A1W1CMD0_9ZZZZ